MRSDRSWSSLNSLASFSSSGSSGFFSCCQGAGPASLIRPAAVVRGLRNRFWVLATLGARNEARESRGGLPRGERDLLSLPQLRRLEPLVEVDPRRRRDEVVEQHRHRDLRARARFGILRRKRATDETRRASGPGAQGRLPSRPTILTRERPPPTVGQCGGRRLHQSLHRLREAFGIWSGGGGGGRGSSLE